LSRGTDFQICRIADFQIGRALSDQRNMPLAVSDPLLEEAVGEGGDCGIPTRNRDVPSPGHEVPLLGEDLGIIFQLDWYHL
jgi:hypothetical protein